MVGGWGGCSEQNAFGVQPAAHREQSVQSTIGFILSLTSFTHSVCLPHSHSLTFVFHVATANQTLHFHKQQKSSSPNVVLFLGGDKSCALRCHMDRDSYWVTALDRDPSIRGPCDLRTL